MITGGTKRNSDKHSENDFIQKYSLYILLTITAVIVLIVFRDFIFFEKLYLFKGLASDSINDTYPNYILISDYLRTDGIPKWSFRQGIGQNIFPFSFPDPFVSFLYLLERENLAYGLAYMEIVKIFLAAVLFYFFLKKRSLSPFVCILGALLYSFSSFMIIGSCWNIFSTEVVYLAFLLLAFEKYYQDNNWTLFPISIALIAILQPFDLWLFGLFLLVYILVRYYEDTEKRSRKLFALLLRTGLLALFGVVITSFFFLNDLRLMIMSPRGEGAAGLYNQLVSQSVLGFESAIHYITVIMRLFSSELLGPSNDFGGWHNFMEAPLFYCGLINLLILPQLFQFLDNRRKLIYSLWLAFITLPAIFPFLRYSFWLFTGDYYRLYSFFVAFILIFFSITALHYMIKHQKVNRKLLLITLAILLTALYFPYDFLRQHDILNTGLRNVISLFLITYTALLYFFKNSPKYLNTIQFSLLFLVCVELVGFTVNNVNERRALTDTEYNQKSGYSDYTNDAIEYIKRIDKGFFRVSKNYSSGPSNFSSLNDSKIQRYRGTASYHSFNQLHYVRFLAGMNIIDGKNENQTRWIAGLRDRPFLHSLVSVKYFLSNKRNSLRHVNYDSLNTIGNIKIYRNKLALPLGFAYNKFISKRDFDKLPPRYKGAVLYQAFVLNDSIYSNYSKDFPSCELSNITKDYSIQNYIADIQSLKNDTFAITKYSSNNIKGNITLKERKMLFFSIPFSGGWSARVDGKKQSFVRINIGFLGLPLEKGEHNIELLFTPPLFYTGAVISIASIFLYIILLVLRRRREKAGIAVNR